MIDWSKSFFAAQDNEQRRYLRDTEELLGNALPLAGDVYAGLTTRALKPFSHKSESETVGPEMLNLLGKIVLPREPLGDLLGDTLLVAALMARIHFVEDHEDVLAEAFASGRRFGDRHQSTNPPASRRGQGFRNWSQSPSAQFANISWEPLPWDEAVRYLQALLPISASEARKLARDMRRYSFGIADVESVRILGLVKGALEDALRSGITVGEFRKRVNALFEAEGLTTLSRHHIENVFHTNLHSAYSAGNWMALHDPDITGYFPYFQYLTAGDDAVRASHKAMHRFTAERNDPVWQLWWPPNGYRCRCRVRAIDKYSAKKKGIEPTLYPGFQPDEGFEGTPMDQLGIAA